MSNIRKGSKVSGKLASGVLVFGVVSSVANEAAELLTNAGEKVVVNRYSLTKLSAADYRSALVVSKPVTKAKKATVTSVTRPSKKSAARTIYATMSKSNSPRKEVITAFIASGLSKKGASTYYQNFKSEKWSA